MMPIEAAIQVRVISFDRLFVGERRSLASGMNGTTQKWVATGLSSDRRHSQGLSERNALSIA